MYIQILTNDLDNKCIHFFKKRIIATHIFMTTKFLYGINLTSTAINIEHTRYVFITTILFFINIEIRIDFIFKFPIKTCICKNISGFYSPQKKSK